MFYQQEQVDEKLLCRICLKKFNDPVLLPCGEFACQTCIIDYIKNCNEQNKRKKFQCYFCKEDHLMPANGFPKSKFMNDLLAIQPKKVDKSILVDRFKSDLNQCMNEINEINYSLMRKEEVVKEYFDLKRHQIQSASRRKIEEIVKRSGEFLARINQLDRERLENLKVE